MGSVLNIAGNYPGYNASDSPEEADCLALEADWQMVGQDFLDVFKELGLTNGSEGSAAGR